MFTINVIMKTKNKGNWNSIPCISYRIFASKSCATHGKSVRVLCARRECKEKLYFLLVTPRQIYSKFPVLRWNFSSLTLYLSVLKRFKLKLLYRRLKYKRSKTDLNCLNSSVIYSPRSQPAMLWENTRKGNVSIGCCWHYEATDLLRWRNVFENFIGQYVNFIFRCSQFYFQDIFLVIRYLWCFEWFLNVYNFQA